MNFSFEAQSIPKFDDGKQYMHFIELFYAYMCSTDNKKLLIFIGDATEKFHSELQHHHLLSSEK